MDIRAISFLIVAIVWTMFLRLLSNNFFLNDYKIIKQGKKGKNREKEEKKEKRTWSTY